MTALESAKTMQQGVVEKVYRAFFSPSAYEMKPTEQAVLERGNNYRLPYNGGELAVTTWGESGPAVLLMHGWGGARAQMTGFVNPLLTGGYRVVAYDQPAHGQSGGRMTNLLEIAPTLEAIAGREGDFDAVIAHSFGTLITSYALVEGDFPPPSRLVYFGAFNRLMDSLPRFQAQAGLPDEIMDEVRNKIFDTFGEEVLDAIANEDFARQIHIPTLMYHDAADEVTPIEDSRLTARAWEEAQFIETSGLGHRGALQSEEIHEQVVGFLNS
jgi:pimeloyl-ACP methyl ester carboxylesterase